MDLFDGIDMLPTLPRRLARVVVMMFVVAMLLFPPVQRWYLAQAEHHAERLTQEILSHLPAPTTSPQPRGGNGKKPGGP